MSDETRPFSSSPRRPAEMDPEELRQLDEDCPIVCVGHLEGTYVFLSPSGERRIMTARELTQNGIASIFDGDAKWLTARFTRYNRDGQVTGFLHDAAARWLMRRCAAAGHFDPATPARGVGVWPRRSLGAADPAVIVHAGDALWMDGAWGSPGVFVDGAIYAARPRIGRPDMDGPAPEETGRQVLAYLRNWSFRVPGCEALLLGLIGTSALGAAAPWRPSRAMTGPRGCGKTELMAFIGSVLGDQANAMQDLSEAGFRQAIASEARTVLIDEAEGGDDGSGGAVQGVVELIRKMAGGAGGKVVRGGQDGRARHTEIVGSVLMAAVLGVDLKPQDRSRITEIELLPPAPMAEETLRQRLAELEFAKEWAGQYSAALRARCIKGHGRFIRDWKLYRRLLISSGCDARQADQYAALIAGRDLLLFDESLDEAAASRSLEPLMPIVLEAMSVDQPEGEGKLCLNHLLTPPAENWSGGQRQTLSILVMSGFKAAVADRHVLGAYGLRVDNSGRDKPALIVAYHHNGLERVFAGTRWARGKWVKALKSLAMVEPDKRPWRFAGIQERALRVPKAYLPFDDESDSGAGSGEGVGGG